MQHGTAMRNASAYAATAAAVPHRFFLVCACAMPGILPERTNPAFRRH
jgi:hypothetical protein